jgi:hypothetical protein
MWNSEGAESRAIWVIRIAQCSSVRPPLHAIAVVKDLPRCVGPTFRPSRKRLWNSG